MNIRTLLFSFEGRIRRLHYWLAVIGSSFALSIVIVVGMSLFGGGLVMAQQGQGGGGIAAGALAIVGVILFVAVSVVAFWIGLALQIKRWHDRDKGAIWVLINLVPFIGGIWALVECGFLDGTPGPNKFGPSPKGLTGPVGSLGAPPPVAPVAN